MTRFVKIPFAALALASVTPAIASTDGSLGTTSNGSFNVNAVISTPPVDNVQVTGLNDITFTGTTEDVSMPSQFNIFCIVRQPGGGNVGVTVSSIAAGDTSFLVRSSAPGGDTIPLVLFMQTMAGVFAPLTEGTEATFAVPSTCSESDSSQYARMEIYLGDGNQLSFAPGNYSATYLVSIAPK